MEIQNPEKQSQQNIMQPITDLQVEPNIQLSEKKLINLSTFNLYKTRISLYEDLLIYITSSGKLFGINMICESGFMFDYPEDKMNFNSSISVIHNDKAIIIYDGKGNMLQAELPHNIYQQSCKSLQLQLISLEWEVIETPFPNGLELFISSYLQDIFTVIRDNYLYFYNSTRKNWTTTTKLEPNKPYGEYLYHGKSLIATFTNTGIDIIADIPPSKTITYFLVVNSTATSDDLQFVPITNPHNQLHKFAPYTSLNILLDLCNPTESTASLRYIKLDRFRATCYSMDNEWTQLPLPSLTTIAEESQSNEDNIINTKYHPIYTQIIIIENTIILISLSGVYYIENAFIDGQPRELPSDWKWKKMMIYNNSQNPLYRYLQSSNQFNVRNLEQNKVIIENKSIIPISILNSNYEKLLNRNTFIITLDGRLILITKDSDDILIGREMVTMMPSVMNPEELKYIFDKCMFYDSYKFDYLSYDKERERLNMLYIANKAALDNLDLQSDELDDSTTNATNNTTDIEDLELAKAISLSLEESNQH